ncbi:hypothetical protein HDV05_004208 [Chytridiales sp. JEL 0842]|nr:hypothetical protein HDV05_004208 [Chytridiales sp. JEL 0842]
MDVLATDTKNADDSSSVHENVYLEVDLLFTRDEEAKEPDALTHQQTRRYKLNGLFDPHHADTKPIIHSHMMVQYTGIFFCCVDMVVSASFVGYHFEPLEPNENTQSISPKVESMTMSGLGCGSMSLLGWFGKRLWTSASSGSTTKKSCTSIYLADQVYGYSGKLKQQREGDEQDFDDISKLPPWTRYQQLMLSSISYFVELQTACIHAYAIRAAHYPTSPGVRQSLLESINSAPVMGVSQIITLVAKGLGHSKAPDSSGKKELPAVGTEGRNNAISGSLSIFDQFVQEHTQDDILQPIIAVINIFSEKLQSLWYFFANEPGMLAMKDIKVARQSSSRLRYSWKSKYVLDSGESDGYMEVLEKAKRAANHRELFIEEDGISPLPVLHDLIKSDSSSRNSVSLPAKGAPAAANNVDTVAPLRSESVADSILRHTNKRLSQSIISGYQPSEVAGPVIKEPYSITARRSLAGIADEEASVLGIAASIISEHHIGNVAVTLSAGRHMDDIEAALADKMKRRNTHGSILTTTMGSYMRPVSPDISPPSPTPSFSPSNADIALSTPSPSSGVHLIVFVHGLLGSSYDLRQYKNRIEAAIHMFDIPHDTHEQRYMISCVNEDDTLDDIEVLADKLVDEILLHIDEQIQLPVERLSLGGLITRCALGKPKMEQFLSKFDSFTTLSSPHLSLYFSKNTILNSMLGFYQILSKSKSIDQLNLKDHKDPRKTLLYLLTTPERCRLRYFKHIRFLASPQDGYVPFASALAENEYEPRPNGWAASFVACGSASAEERAAADAEVLKRGPMGAVYREMVLNLRASLNGGDANVDSNLNSTSSSSARVPIVERYIVKFGTVEMAQGMDVVKRKAHIAMLEDPGFCEILVLINRMHL